MKTKKHILILDDDIDIIKLITKVLDNAGHSTHYATHATDFFKQVDAIAPHLIIIDNKLGHEQKDGIHIIESLKKDSHYKNIPIFLISSSPSKQLVTMATQLGAEEFITKPLQANVLLQKVKKSLKFYELPTIEFPETIKVKCKTESEIIQISEAALKIKGPVKYSENIDLNIESTFLTKLGCQACRYKTNPYHRVKAPGEYINEIRMKGVKEETAKKIRLIKATTKS